jgi:hypothetical protein
LALATPRGAAGRSRRQPRWSSPLSTFHRDQRALPAADELTQELWLSDQPPDAALMPFSGRAGSGRRVVWCRGR